MFLNVNDDTYIYIHQKNQTTSQLRKSLVFTDFLTRWFIYGGGSLIVRNFLPLDLDTGGKKIDDFTTINCNGSL